MISKLPFFNCYLNQNRERLTTDYSILLGYFCTSIWPKWEEIFMIGDTRTSWNHHVIKCNSRRKKESMPPHPCDWISKRFPTPEIHFCKVKIQEFAWYRRMVIYVCSMVMFTNPLWYNAYYSKTSVGQSCFHVEISSSFLSFLIPP